MTPSSHALIKGSSPKSANTLANGRMDRPYDGMSMKVTRRNFRYGPPGRSVQPSPSRSFPEMKTSDATRRTTGTAKFLPPSLALRMHFRSTVFSSTSSSSLVSGTPSSIPPR